MATFALIGAAHIHTPGFVKTMAQRDDVTVKYVWDHDADRAAKNVALLPGSTAADLDTILNDSTVEAVVVCSETIRHEELVPAICKKKKHLFVEKPLGIGYADSKKMLTAIEKAGVTFHTGFNRRRDPAHQFIKEQIKLGHFGKITHAAHSNCHSGTIGRWFDTDWRWMADPERAGVGAFGDLGGHSLDVLINWLGEVETCTADLSIVLGNYGSCDETGHGMLKFTSGATANLFAGWASYANPVEFEVSGTEGHAWKIAGQLFFNSKHVEGADGKQPWTELPAPLPDPLSVFLDAINGLDHPPLITAREAAYCGVVMEAMYQGAENHKWIAPKAL